jgi:hypothetical protein
MKPNKPKQSESIAFAIIELAKLYPNDKELGKRIRELIKYLNYEEV